MATFWRKAKIHSLKGALADVEVLEWINDNCIIVRYDGIKCRAILNPFDGNLYADDVYGRVM